MLDRFELPGDKIAEWQRGDVRSACSPSRFRGHTRPLKGVLTDPPASTGADMSEAAAFCKVPVGQVVEVLCALPEDAFHDVDRVRQLLLANPVDPASLAPFLCWDRQHYTRNLIEKTAIFELLALCWEVGQASAIHNHRDQNCWMAAAMGQLLVQNYRVISKDVAAHRCQLEPTDLIELNAQRPCAVDPREPVHSVFNPKESGERAVTLHVYSRPFDSCEVYSVEQGTWGDIQLRYTTVKGTPVAK